MNGHVNGLIPRLNGSSIYIAVGIFGATVMPHNLYLHSALVQTRRIGRSKLKKERVPVQSHRFHLALNGALFVNAAILILAAAVFFKQHRGYADSTGTSTPNTLTRHHLASILSAPRYCVRPIVHFDRHHGRTNCNGRISSVPHPAMATPACHSLAGDRARRTHHLLFR